MKTGLLAALLAVSAVFTFTSCESNKGKIVKDYLSTIKNEDGSTTKIKQGKYKFQSFEEIAVDGKYVYSLVEDSSGISKDSVLGALKKAIDEKNRSLLLSAIFFKRSMNCSLYEWHKEMEYQEKSESYWDTFMSYNTKAKLMGKIYNNFDNQSLYLIKAIYDYKIGDIETKNITSYFVYDKEGNKILKQFDSLEEDFFAYYSDSLEDVDIESYNDFKSNYEQLLDKPLEELLKAFQRLSSGTGA
jgi:hypothetical protein